MLSLTFPCLLVKLCAYASTSPSESSLFLNLTITHPTATSLFSIASSPFGKELSVKNEISPKDIYLLYGHFHIIKNNLLAERGFAIQRTGRNVIFH